MIIPIDNKYRISTDKNGWMIQEKFYLTDKTSGQMIEHFKSTHWYTTVSGAVKGLAELLIRTSEAETLEAAIEEVNNVASKLAKALEPRLRITVQ